MKCEQNFNKKEKNFKNDDLLIVIKLHTIKNNMISSVIFN